MTQDKLTITIGQRDRLRDDALEQLERAESGDTVPEADPVLNFGTDADLAQVLTEAKLGLLRAIAQENPDSISDAAEIVDRDYKEVHRNMDELAAMGLIEFERNGRSKRPIVPYDSLTIDIDLLNTPDRDQPQTSRSAVSESTSD